MVTISARTAQDKRSRSCARPRCRPGQQGQAPPGDRRHDDGARRCQSLAERDQDGHAGRGTAKATSSSPDRPIHLTRRPAAPTRRRSARSEPLTSCPPTRADRAAPPPPRWISGPDRLRCGRIPTGDWYGTLNWTHIVTHPRATTTTTASADLSLALDGKGGLTGRMVGTHSSTSKMGPCAGSTTTPGGIQTSLVGSYTPGRDAMTIRADDKQTRPTTIQIFCPGAKPVVSQQPGAYEPYERALTAFVPPPAAARIGHEPAISL